MDHISITCFQWHTDILVPCIVILGLVRRAKMWYVIWYGKDSNAHCDTHVHVFSRVILHMGTVHRAQDMRGSESPTVHWGGAVFSMSGTIGDCLKHCGHIGDQGHASAPGCFV